MPHQHCLVDLCFSEPARLGKICLHDPDDDDDGYDDPNGDDDDDADDDDDHLLRGEKGLDSNLLSSPASKPYFAISEIINCDDHIDDNHNHNTFDDHSSKNGDDDDNDDDDNS